MPPTSDMASPPGFKSARTSAGSSSCNDGFDCLPDELIHHVLSFLAARETVRTSVLSRRWRNLWASMPCLNIDVGDFDNDLQFEKFLVHALPLLDDSVPLRTFRLRSLFSFSSDSWVNHAIKRKVPVLEYSEHEDCYTNVNYNLILASSYLTKVVLKHVELDDRVFGPLNNACPALENLELLDAWIWFSEISSISLKHLRIVACTMCHEFSIRTPNLLTMCLDNIQGRNSLVLEDLPSLTTASISVYRCFLDRDIEYEYFSHDEFEHRIIGGLSHARSLKLIAPLREALFERGLPTCPVFNNLKFLVLGDWCMAFDLYSLGYVLKQSPMLRGALCGTS